MAVGKENFFKDWDFETINSNLENENIVSNENPIKEENDVSRLRISRSKRRTSILNNNFSSTVKINIKKKLDGFELCTGDTVLYQHANGLLEAWYIYNIEADQLDKKINVSGLRLVSADFLKTEYSIEPPIFGLYQNTVFNQLIIIPEVDMLSSDAWFKKLNVYSLNDCSSERVKNHNELDIKVVQYVFDPVNKQFFKIDFDQFKQQCTGDVGAFERLRDLMTESIPVVNIELQPLKIDKKQTEIPDISEEYKTSVLNINETEILRGKKRNNSDNNESQISLKKIKVDKIPTKDPKQNFLGEPNNNKTISTDEEDVNESFSDEPDNFSETAASDEYIPENIDLENEESNIIEDELEEEEDIYEMKSVQYANNKTERKYKSQRKKPSSKIFEKEHKLTTAANYANSYQKNHLSMRIKSTGDYRDKPYAEEKEDNINRFKAQLSCNQGDSSFLETLEPNTKHSEVPGREDEFANLYSRIASFINSGVGSSIYISGVPGTGKSFTVKKTIEYLLKQNAQAFSFAEINGLKLINPDDCYENLCDKLQLSLKVKEKAVVALERYFSKQKNRKIVLLLDEIDVLLAHDSEILYNFFNWPYLEKSNLFVIAIGNKMNLSEQLNSKTNSRLGTSNSIQFSPYTVTELETILKYRLVDESEKSRIFVEKESGKVALFSSFKSKNYVYTHKSNFKILKIVFPSISIQFLAKSGALASSDVRTAKGIGLSAMELVEQEYIKKNGVIYNYEKFFLNDEVEDSNSEFEVEELKVTASHISQARMISHSASVKDYVQCLSTLSKLILFSAIELSNEYETTNLYFRNVIDKLDTYLDTYRDKKVLRALIVFTGLNAREDINTRTRVIDWDFAVNQLNGSGLVEITRLSNERANSFIIKNKQGIEEGLSLFRKELR